MVSSGSETTRPVEWNDKESK